MKPDSVFRNGVELTPPPKAAINAITFSDTGLTCGTTYNYEVKAMNADGDSTAATASGSTSGCPGAPTAPSALTATAASQTQINLSWTDNSSDDNNSRECDNLQRYGLNLRHGLQL